MVFLGILILKKGATPPSPISFFARETVVFSPDEWVSNVNFRYSSSDARNEYKMQNCHSLSIHRWSISPPMKMTPNNLSVRTYKNES